MSNTCPICVHSQRTSIDAALANDSALGAVAGQFGVTVGALALHWSCCTLQLTETPEVDKEAARRAGVDAEREYRDATYDGAALDGLLAAILQPAPQAAEGGRRWQP